MTNPESLDYLLGLYDIQTIMDKQLVRNFKFFAGSVILALAALNTQAQNSLTAADVQTIIAQAVSQAVAMNQKVTVSVLDKEAHRLGTFAIKTLHENRRTTHGQRLRQVQLQYSQQDEQEIHRHTAGDPRELNLHARGYYCY